MTKKRILFWVDLEMTGLSDEQVIIEIASLVTDAQLNVLAEGPEIAIKRTQEEMSRMEDWPAKQHQISGLLERVEKSKSPLTKQKNRDLNSSANGPTRIVQPFAAIRSGSTGVSSIRKCQP